MQSLTSEGSRFAQMKYLLVEEGKEEGVEAS